MKHNMGLIVLRKWPFFLIPKPQFLWCKVRDDAVADIVQFTIQCHNGVLLARYSMIAFKAFSMNV